MIINKLPGIFPFIFSLLLYTTARYMRMVLSIYHNSVNEHKQPNIAAVVINDYYDSA